MNVVVIKNMVKKSQTWIITELKLMWTKYYGQILK